MNLDVGGDLLVGCFSSDAAILAAATQHAGCSE